MELKIQQQEMPLLSLKRVTGEITFSGATPSYQEVSAGIAKQLNTKPELIKIKHIYTDFKTQNAQVIANVYNDQKTFDKFLTKKEKAAIVKAKEEAKKKITEEKVATETVKPEETKTEAPIETPKEETAPAEEQPKEE